MGGMGEQAWVAGWVPRVWRLPTAFITNERMVLYIRPIALGWVQCAKPNRLWARFFFMGVSGQPMNLN